MTVPAKHGLYAIGVGSTTLAGITRQNLVLGNEVRAEANSGEIYARHAALYAQKMAPGFTTIAIRNALSACGLGGVSLESLTGGLCLYAQKHADGSTRAGAGNHRKYGFVKGILAPSRLTCTHRGDATLEYQCVTAAPNAATCPLTITEGANVPTMPADGGRFTLGPLSIAGSTYEGKRDLSIEFGIDLVPESSDSDLWDTLVSIRVVATKITFVGVDLEWLKSTRIPITGKAAAHADTSFYLRKRATGNASAFVDNGTAQHIKFTANGLAVVPNAFDASGNEGATCNLELTTTHDGTNDPLKLTLDTDIS